MSFVPNAGSASAPAGCWATYGCSKVCSHLMAGRCRTPDIEGCRSNIRDPVNRRRKYARIAPHTPRFASMSKPMSDSMPETRPPHLFSYPRYWAECFGTAPYLPMSRAEMDQLGWDSCDIIIVTADAYVDHPSFGMAVVGRLLESQGFRVGIIAQPEWNSAEPFKALGKPNLFFGVTGGNMDSLINRYTSDLRMRAEDAYTPHAEAGKRPDRSVIVYSQRCREAYYDVPIVIGGIEASLRRIAQYDYWSDQVRQSVLIDSNANILLYGNAERALVELAHQVALGRSIEELNDLRGTAVIKRALPAGWTEIDSSRVDWPGRIDQIPNPYDVPHDQVGNPDARQYRTTDGTSAAAAGDETAMSEQTAMSG